MRIISTRMHGISDYLMALVLIASPWLFGFATGGVAQWLPVVLGVVLLLQSLMTRYELGAFPLISMPVHLGMDVVSGLLLASSPWLFGFADTLFWPHLILGLIEVGTAAMTETTPHMSGRMATSHR